MKYDPKDGRYKLFEINLRQERSNYFVSLNGTNMAQCLVEEWIYQKPFTQTVYREGEPGEEYFWLDVPKKVFQKYTSNNLQKEKALRLMEEGKAGTTVFYSKDRSLRH